MIEKLYDIVETAVRGGHTAFARVLSATALFQVLREPGPYTVFVPGNGAFDRLPEGALELLVQDRPRLAAVLWHHVARGRLLAAELLRQDRIQLLDGRTALPGLARRLTLDDVPVLEENVLAANGVIHVIDGILWPPSGPPGGPVGRPGRVLSTTMPAGSIAPGWPSARRSRACAG
jgi:uncharacterized surface protein with fasciclin (FAS1) repeats